MGYFSITQLAATYAPLLALGAWGLAERDVPVALGRGDNARAQSIETSAAAIGISISVVGLGLLAGIALLGNNMDAATQWTIGCSGVLLTAQQIGTWAVVRLRTRMRFRALGWVSAANALGLGIFAVAGAILWGTVGALAGVALISIIQAALLVFVAGIRLARLPPLWAFRTALLESPAFLVAGLTTALLLNIDQIAVATSLTPSDLGIYSAAYLGNAFALRIPGLVSSALFPRFQRLLGYTGDLAQVYEMTLRAASALLLAVTLLVGILFVVMPIALSVVLPNFVEAIVPMRILLVGVVGIALSTPASQFLVTAHRQRLQVGLSGAVLAGMATVYVVSAASGRMSLTLAAAADAAGYIILGLLLQCAAVRSAGRPLRSVGAFVPIYALVPSSLLAASVVGDALGGTRGGQGAIVSAALQLAVFGVTWGLLASRLLRRHEAYRQDAESVVGATSGLVRRLFRKDVTGD
jgi:O-antigen/teichoic acid export membrane protein